MVYGRSLPCGSQAELGTSDPRRSYEPLDPSHTPTDRVTLKQSSTIGRGCFYFSGILLQFLLMKIAIDARLYGLKNRGLGRFLIEHLKGLEAADEQTSYSVFLKEENIGEYQPAKKNFVKKIWNTPWYSLKEQTDTTILKNEQADLYYFPHWNVPMLLGKPYVVTIHDMILFDYPDRRASTQSWLRYKLKYLAFRMLMGAVLARAKAVVAVSGSTRDAILKHFPQTKSIQVIYEGAPELAQSEVVNLGKHGIQKPYILYVGAAYPHKNLPFLLRSFQEARKMIDCQLVLVGRKDFFYERLASEAAQAGLDRDVVFFGGATDGELAYLYEHSRVAVSPSLVEGFGFGGLEAMTKDIPVDASRIPCFQEIFGDAPQYFDPSNVSDCARVLAEVYTSEELRGRMITAGREIPKRYDWIESARKYKKLFEKLRE